MQITRQADYAVRTVLHLAKMGESERAATRTVVAEQNIPPSFLAKIISQLAIVLIDRTRAARRLDARHPEPGFPGMDLTTESEGFDPESHFLVWKPGSVPAFEPPGMAWRIDRETDLVLNLHLRPSGKPETIAPAIGLYFTPEAPRLNPMLVQLEDDGALDIPPGARHFVVTDEYVLPVGVDLLGIYPHAHYLGRDFAAWATLPDGTRRSLIRIPDWDVNWQGVYRYGSHGHRPGHQPGKAGDQHAVAAGFGGGHADDQTGSGNDAVISAEHAGTEPADAVSEVGFSASYHGCFR